MQFSTTCEASARAVGSAMHTCRARELLSAAEVLYLEIADEREN
jgi:hypothetical protein